MTYNRNTDDPKVWRSRAAEARTIAGERTTEETRQNMLQIAENYEKVARAIEGRISRRRFPPLWHNPL